MFTRPIETPRASNARDAAATRASNGRNHSPHAAGCAFALPFADVGPPLFRAAGVHTLD